MKPLLTLILLALSSSIANAESSTTTTVTTYVTKTQQEREQTRFTLTEWLRIKERMKLMDVWLAMFSKPKEIFSPELYLKYSIGKGESILANNDSQSSGFISEQIDAQLWLTNLFSSTTNLRTVNIDLGFQGHQTQSKSTIESLNALALGESEKKQQTTSLMMCLRLFGKNIQDSSLVIKGGRYNSNDGYNFIDPASFKFDHQGSVAGADLQLYLFKWLGVTGNYLQYKSETKDRTKLNGIYHDYMAFVEISLLRFMFGKFQETWNDADLETPQLFKGDGLISGIQLQL